MVGGLLAKGQEEVGLLGRARHLDRIRREGLRIRGILGGHRISSCALFTDWREVPSEGWDVVLVTVKSYDTAQVARHLPVFVSPSCLVVSLQNGLGNWEALAQHVSSTQLVGGRVIFGVELEAGVATVTVWGGEILLGSVDSSGSSERILPIAQAMSRVGLETRITDRIRQALWGKVIYNCALNPLSSLLQVPYGDLLKAESTRRMIRSVVEEAYAVAEAEGISLSPPTAEEYGKELFQRLIPATAAHHPSMLQDIRAGRQTEIDALNGALVRKGERHQVPTPVNSLLTELIHALEGLKRGQGGAG